VGGIRNHLSDSRSEPVFGCGGLDIAFHDAGFQIDTAVEIDGRFAATLCANTVERGYLEGTKVLCQDVRSFHPPVNWQVDFIIGGPPCQSFSAAGRRAAGVRGTQDDRGALFQEYVRLLKQLQPRCFLFENMYGITGAEQGKAWQSIKPQAIMATANLVVTVVCNWINFVILWLLSTALALCCKAGTCATPNAAGAI
jgi:C-5 cytosine-specific DNA methylase